MAIKTKDELKAEIATNKLKQQLLVDMVDSSANQTDIADKADRDGDSLTNCTINGVVLNGAGSAANFLNEAGNYVLIPGSNFITNTAELIAALESSTELWFVANEFTIASSDGATITSDKKFVGYGFTLGNSATLALTKDVGSDVTVEFQTDRLTSGTNVTSGFQMDNDNVGTTFTVKFRDLLIQHPNGLRVFPGSEPVVIEYEILEENNGVITDSTPVQAWWNNTNKLPRITEYCDTINEFLAAALNRFVLIIQIPPTLDLLGEDVKLGTTKYISGGVLTGGSGSWENVSGNDVSVFIEDFAEDTWTVIASSSQTFYTVGTYRAVSPNPLGSFTGNNFLTIQEFVGWGDTDLTNVTYNGDSTEIRLTGSNRGGTFFVNGNVMISSDDAGNINPTNFKALDLVANIDLEKQNIYIFQATATGGVGLADTISGYKDGTIVSGMDLFGITDGDVIYADPASTEGGFTAVEPLVSGKRLKIGTKIGGGLSTSDGIMLVGIEILGPTIAVNHLMSKTLIDGGVITIASTTTVDITAATISQVDNFTDVNNPTSQIVTVGPFLGVTITDIATESFTRLAIDSAGLLVQLFGIGTEADKRDFVSLGAAVHLTNTVIEQVSNALDRSPIDLALQISDLADALGAKNTSGNNYSAATIINKIQKTAGTVFSHQALYKTNKKAPSEITTAALDPTIFTYTYRDGVGGFILSSQSDVVNVVNFDDGTGGTDRTPNGVIGNNQFTVARIFFFATSNSTMIQYGQNTYSSLAVAIDSRLSEVIENSPLTTRAIFRGWFIYQKNTTDFTDLTEVTFINVSAFSTGGGGGGGGATAFTALTDTPATYAGQAGKLVQVNAGETALDFIAPASFYRARSHNIDDWNNTTSIVANSIWAHHISKIDVGGANINYLLFKTRNMDLGMTMGLAFYDATDTGAAPIATFNGLVPSVTNVSVETKEKLSFAGVDLSSFSEIKVCLMQEVAGDCQVGTYSAGLTRTELCFFSNNGSTTWPTTLAGMSVDGAQVPMAFEIGEE